jgi:hypothetical protein
MKPVTVHPEAEAEADQAFARYWAQSQAAAFGFDDELTEAFKRLRAGPSTGAPFLRGTRRILLDRYPLPSSSVSDCTISRSLRSRTPNAAPAIGPNV